MSAESDLGFLDNLNILNSLFLEQSDNFSSPTTSLFDNETILLNQANQHQTKRDSAVENKKSPTTDNPELDKFASITESDFYSNSNLQLSNTFESLHADLQGEFRKIELPDTVEFGDEGKVTFRIMNRGNALAKGPLTFKLYISTDNNIDRNAQGDLVNDALLTTIVKDIHLRPGKSTTFTFDYDNITSVVAPGAYYLIAEIDSENDILESKENNNIISKYVSAPHTDAVIDWNATALNAIQAEGEAGRGVPPTIGSRLLAIVSAAVYETVNAFYQTHTPYALDIIAPGRASVQAAAAGAAYRVLAQLLPNQIQLFDQQMMLSLNEIQDSKSREKNGVLFGYSVADQILALRENDGWDNNEPYSPPTGDYIWHPGQPGTPNPGVAVGCNWGKVTPFAINSIEDFAPDGLDGQPGTDQYAQEMEEVRLFGGKENTALTTIARNADQTEIAWFWAYDRADTFRPYGQLNQIAEEIAVREGNTLAENARLFAQLNIAVADAAIVAWDSKYKIMQPRPDDVIVEGFAENDGMEKTVCDPDWSPLLGPTPPFPDYISGHSSFGGAFAGVLTKFFGEDYRFETVSQELIGVTRTYNSFYEAGYDDAISRIYGGVHVREATITDALPMGVAIGNFVADHLFQPIAELG